jgi:hypothetical protein
VRGAGCRVQSVGCRVQSVGCRVMGSGSGNEGRGYRTQGLSVRSCVLIKLRPKKRFFPSASYGHLVRRASDPEKERREALRKTKTPPDLGEALVTACPYETVGGNFFWPGLNKDAEGTVYG